MEMTYLEVVQSSWYMQIMYMNMDAEPKEHGWLR